MTLRRAVLAGAAVGLTVAAAVFTAEHIRRRRSWRALTTPTGTRTPVGAPIVPAGAAVSAGTPNTHHAPSGAVSGLAAPDGASGAAAREVVAGARGGVPERAGHHHERPAGVPVVSPVGSGGVDRSETFGWEPVGVVGAAPGSVGETGLGVLPTSLRDLRQAIDLRSPVDTSGVTP